MIAFCKKSSVHKVWCFSILKKWAVGNFRYTGRLVQWPTTAVWAREKTALCQNNFLSRPVSTGSLVYGPAALGHQPVPLRSSRSDPCPDLKHLPWRLPQRPGPHPLESPSDHARFGQGKKQYGKTCVATSPRIVTSPHAPSDYSLCRLGSEHDQAVAWPRERGFGVSEDGGGRPNAAQFSHNLWQSQVALTENGT